MRWKPTRRLYWVAVVSMASVVAVACGGDDDDEASNVERYCELVQELDNSGSEAFADIEEDESATEEDFAEAERQFVEAHQDDFDELREVSRRTEYADDIDVLLAAQEERAAGGEQEEVSDEVVAAEEQAFAGVRECELWGVRVAVSSSRPTRRRA